MQPRSVQLVKEVRQLAWPWAIVTLPGLAVLVQQWVKLYPDLPRSAGPLQNPGEWILPLGLFVGTSLLAVLPLGAEFQYRTLATRFAQPIQRGDLWRQKFFLSLAAVALPSVIYCLAVGVHFSWPFSLMAAAWIMVTVAGAVPFTLLARTTIGGMVLNCAGGTAVTFAWTYYEKHGHIPAPWLVAIGALLAAYSATMIWLGRRMMIRFQAVDGMQAGEGFVPGARFVPRAIVDWFRCRDAQPLRNLVRREFHLMRTLWPLVAFYLAAWIFLVAFHQLPNDQPDSVHVSFVLTAILGLLIVVLAGTLSLGEEKTSGTHDWHMTMPVSISAQWAVKLVVALLTSVLCAALLPMLVTVVGGWLTGSPWAFLTGKIAALWMAEAALLTFAAFWCSCIVRGTVIATLWVFPVLFGIGFASAAADIRMTAFARSFRQFIASLVARLDPVAVAQTTHRLFDFAAPQQFILLAIGPLLTVGLIQSHRLFRAQVPANRLRVVWCALPLLLVSFLCSTIGPVTFVVYSVSMTQESAILDETDTTIAALTEQDLLAGSVRPRNVSPEELARASTSLSPMTQRWLRGASITLAPAPERVNSRGFYLPGRIWFGVRREQVADRIPYSAVIRTARGNQCALVLHVQKQVPAGLDPKYWRPYTFGTAFCQ